MQTDHYLPGAIVFLLFLYSNSGADEVLEIPDTPQPGYLQSVIDPVFSNKVTRISDNPGSLIQNLDARWDSVARHQYSKNAVWNCDQSLIFLGRHNGFPSKIFLDGRTYEPLFGHNSPPGSEVRWHTDRPDCMVYVDNNVFGIWNVRTDERSTVETFPGYSGLAIGPWEGNLSLDGKRIALSGKKGELSIAFVYDISQKKKHPDLTLDEVRIDWVSISASGNYLVVNGSFDDSTPDQTQVFDIEGNPVGELWSELGRPSHYDLTLDSEGNDIAVGVSKTKPDDGRVIKRRLKDGKVTVLTSGGYASHVSTRNIDRPGWAYATYQHRGPTWPPYFDEVIAVKLDGSLTVERIAHLHTYVTDYLTEAHATPSPDGRRVIWAGNWGNKTGRPIGTYVTEQAQQSE